MRSFLLIGLSLYAASAWGQNTARPAAAPATARGLLTITILDGDEAILSPRKRVSRESIIQVQDENHRPVGGVLLTFTSPNTGASATFQNGSRLASLYTDERGHATLRGIRPNQASGRYGIRITASKEGSRTATGEIHLTNAVPTVAPAAGLSTKAIIAIVAGAAAAAGAGIALKGGGSSQAGRTGGLPSLTLQPGSPVVGPPR